jgi:hypothetical protein
MVESGKSFVEVHNPTDDTVNTFALKFFFVGVEMVLQGL